MRYNFTCEWCLFPVNYLGGRMRKCVFIRGWCDGNKRSLAEKVENVATPRSAISSALYSRLINDCCISLSLLFQGYEGSLLKVTSKNGKTSSVSESIAPKIGTRPLFRISLGKNGTWRENYRVIGFFARHSSLFVYFAVLAIETEPQKAQTKLNALEYFVRF